MFELLVEAVVFLAQILHFLQDWAKYILRFQKCYEREGGNLKEGALASRLKTPTFFARRPGHCASLRHDRFHWSSRSLPRCNHESEIQGGTYRNLGNKSMPKGTYLGQIPCHVQNDVVFWNETQTVNKVPSEERMKYSKRGIFRRFLPIPPSNYIGGEHNMWKLLTETYDQNIPLIL